MHPCNQFWRKNDFALKFPELVKYSEMGQRKVVAQRVKAFKESRNEEDLNSLLELITTEYQAEI